jgi:hypothetical protein
MEDTMNAVDTTKPALQTLTLKKETLRRLTAPELQFAVGGAPTAACTEQQTICGSC